MALVPQIKPRKVNFVLKTCPKCGGSYGAESFAPTRSFYFPEGVVNICDGCIAEYLDAHDWDWKEVDKLCQMADIPFVPREWERLKEMNGANVFHKYAEVFLDSQYDNLGWSDYYAAFKKLKQENSIEAELPEVNEAKRQEQRQRWGANYDDEALDYLDRLFQGLMTTQNVNGALQIDQALKICKMSYEIDCRIREGVDFDKLLGSYDKLVKAADFTPKNVKNINDFDSSGELIKWMEKNGWKNPFYDGVTRDVVDETIQNFQMFNQRLYTNETGIADEIARRCEALKTTHEMENNFYGTDKAYDLDEYADQAYVEEEDGDFQADLEEEDNE